MKIKFPNFLCHSSNKLKGLAQKISVLSQRRYISSAVSNSTRTENWGEMRCWQIHSYSGLSELGLSKIPPLLSPRDVLVKVHSSSVNPIDVAMRKGYGAESINVLRGLSSLDTLPLHHSPFATKVEFPLVLGRDFSGTVEELGHGISKEELILGDKVFGVVGVQRQGSHAEYLVASADTISRKPSNTSFTGAASIPYVACTAWGAIRVSGGYRKASSLGGKRFLVLGGGGGVGTFAIQYLKARGATVVSTCSGDAVPLLTSLALAPELVIDYKLPDCAQLLKGAGPYDCILDLTGSSPNLQHCAYLRAGGGGQYITLSPPFLRNIDKHGLGVGMARNALDLLKTNFESWRRWGSCVKWAFFIPHGGALEEVAQLLQSNEIRPVVEKTFKFEEAAAAYDKVEAGHLRGKIVIDAQMQINKNR